MNKLLKIAMGAAVISSFVVSAAFAGQNAAGTGQLGWLDAANNKMKTSRDETDCSPRMGLTVKGISRLRGADCQLYINGVSGNLPPSWQWWADANGQGCAAGANLYAQGFKTNLLQPAADSIYNAWSTAPLVPGAATGQAGAQYYNVNPCLTPHGVGMIWFAAAGTSGVVRAPSKTFGLFSLLVDQTTGCPGDCSSPEGICILVQFRQPCSDPGNPRGAVYGVTDQTNTYDFLPVAVPYLTWNALGNGNCPGVTPVQNGSWGQLKRTYR